MIVVKLFSRAADALSGGEFGGFWMKFVLTREMYCDSNNNKVQQLLLYGISIFLLSLW